MNTAPLRARPNGFAMVELIISLAVMVMLAATVTPMMIAAVDRARVERAREILDQLEDAVIAFEGDTGRWPGNLQHLGAQITTGQQRLCGTNYNNGDVNGWDGPYINKPISASGLSVVIGTAGDVIGDYSPTANQPYYLYFVVPSVREEDAILLDQMVDGGNGASAGSIWYLGGTAGNPDLFYMLAIGEDC